MFWSMVSHRGRGPNLKNRFFTCTVPEITGTTWDYMGVLGPPGLLFGVLDLFVQVDSTA